MKFTYYGHACFAVELNKKILLFDPYISPNPLAKKIDIDKIRPDYILVSHAHGDHIADVEQIAEKSEASLISSFEVCNWFEKKGISKVNPLGLGGKKEFDFGTVKFVLALHSSSFPDGSYGGNPGGFVITSSEGNFYYAGDTALTLDMQLIPEYAEINFAVLPIGDNFTVGYEDAQKIAKMVKTKTAIGVHYNTFDLIKTDTEKAKEYFLKNGTRLLLPAIGETINV
ncbi:MAG: metal-dependent hydrolase [Bacteroidota bacterium]|nr:metal-dependent hydrolase [Bacteroidota bacterium]